MRKTIPNFLLHSTASARTGHEAVPPHPQGMDQDLCRSTTTRTQCPNHCRSPGMKPLACEQWGRKKSRYQCAIPEPCGPTFGQTLLYAHMTNPPTNPPTNTSIFTATPRQSPCEHVRCNLYESNKMSRRFIIGRGLFCPVYQILNHAAKHTYHIERSLRTRPRLRHSLAKLTYVPEQNSAITSTRLFLITLREHPAQDISSLLDNLRSQHAHLVTTRPLIGDPNTNNTQSPLTHALHSVARTLNIPSSQHSIPNPRPTATQQHK